MFIFLESVFLLNNLKYDKKNDFIKKTDDFLKSK